MYKRGGLKIEIKQKYILKADLINEEKKHKRF